MSAGQTVTEIKSTFNIKVNLGPAPANKIIPTMHVRRMVDGAIIKVNVKDFPGKRFPAQDYEALKNYDPDEHELEQIRRQEAAIPLVNSVYTHDQLAVLPIAKIRALPEFKRLKDVKQFRSKEEIVDAVIKARGKTRESLE